MPTFTMGSHRRVHYLDQSGSARTRFTVAELGGLIFAFVDPGEIHFYLFSDSLDAFHALGSSLCGPLFRVMRNRAAQCHDPILWQRR
jgi:hypothetical protein